MSTDRELLEAAAKAAGLKVRCVGNGEPNGTYSFYAEPSQLWWNPLVDDGDAFRLATHLRIDLCFEKTHSVGAYTERDEWFHEHCDQGKAEQILDKARRAITRAAASMAA